ncbi:Dihydrolipoyl dehydrogenase 3 [Streptomyces sp. ADI92-24]|nr:Dihydrolipoyl dehydrogenase 3 [Streptomyces sp. ADI92-24]
MVKVVAERGGRVLGVHLVGPHVSEMIAESRLIVGWDAEPSDVAHHAHPHPTLSEAVGEAFLTLAGRGLHQQARELAGHRARTPGRRRGRVTRAA